MTVVLLPLTTLPLSHLSAYGSNKQKLFRSTYRKLVGMCRIRTHPRWPCSYALIDWDIRPWFRITCKDNFIQVHLFFKQFLVPKLGPKLGGAGGGCHFLKLGSLIFLQIACTESLQQYLTSRRDKIQEKKFGSQSLDQRGLKLMVFNFISSSL